MTNVREDVPITTINFRDGSQDWFTKWINVVTDIPRFCKANGWVAYDAQGKAEDHREQVELTFKPYLDKVGKGYVAIDCKRRVTQDEVFYSEIPVDAPLDNALVESDTYFKGFWGKMHLFYGTKTESFQWNISRRYVPIPSEDTPWDMWKLILSIIANKDTPTTIRMWGEDRGDDDKYADDVTHYTVIGMEFDTGDTKTVVKYAPARDDGTLYQTFSRGWQQHQAAAHKPVDPPAPDYLTFPPDDGSGDWFYQSLVAAMDTPRLAGVYHRKPFDWTDEVLPLHLLINRAYTPHDAGGIFYLNLAPNVTDKPKVLNALSPWALLFPGDGTNTAWEQHHHDGEGVWDDSLREIFIHQRYETLPGTQFTVVRGVDATLARLPVVAVNYYWAGVNADDEPKHGKNDWTGLDADTKQMGRLDYNHKVQVDGVPHSDLVGVIFHLLGNYPDQATFVYFEGLTVAEPTGNFTTFRTRVYQQTKAEYLDSMFLEHPGGITAKASAQGIVVGFEQAGKAPVVDFTFSPYPVKETYITALRRELDKAGLNYASPTNP